MSEGGYRDLAWFCKTLTHTFLNFLKFMDERTLYRFVIATFIRHNFAQPVNQNHASTQVYHRNSTSLACKPAQHAV